MLNLTTSTIVLLPTVGNVPITLAPAGKDASATVSEGLVLRRETIDIGGARMDSATLQPPTPAQVAALNRLLDEQIAHDRAANGGDGLVLVERRLLRHVSPRLARQVAAPRSEPARAHYEQTVRTSMLIRPPGVDGVDLSTAPTEQG